MIDNAIENIISVRLAMLLIYPITPPREEGRTRSIFTRIKGGLNSEFSFSLTSSLNKVLYRGYKTIHSEKTVRLV